MEEEEEQPRQLSLAEVLARRIKVDEYTLPTRYNPAYRYIVGPHKGPNHEMRRAARRAQERRYRNYMSWRRQLERVGIDPDAVLKQREERRARLAARGDRHAGGGDAGVREVPEAQRQAAG